MAQTQMIRLADIRRDGKARATQVRVITNLETVEQYAESLNAGDTFPPVSLVADGKGRYYIADGWHRVEAYAALGRTTVPAKLLEGFEGHTPIESATRHAMKSNLKHGLRLSQGDQRKKAQTALLLPSMQPLGDRKIAREIGTSAQTVMRARAGLVRERLIPHPLTGIYFDDWCPSDYAQQLAFKEAFPDGVDQFDDVYSYVRKLTTNAPSDWLMALEDEGNIREGMVLHSGIVAGKVLAFFPFENPIVKGLPSHYLEVDTDMLTDGDKPERAITKADREEWKQRGITKEIAAAEKRLMAKGPNVAAAMRNLVELWDQPELRGDLRTVFGGRVSPHDGVNPLEEDF